MFWPLLLSLILFILFETDALATYIKLFRLENYAPNFHNYNDIVESGGSVHYLKYLHKIDDRFFVSLVSCAVCLSVSLSVIFSLISWNLYIYPVINVGGLIIFYLLKLLNKYSVN